MFGWFSKQPESAPPGERAGHKQTLRIEAAELAQLLLDKLVRKIVVDEAEHLRLDPGATARYEAKTRLYQMAAVFMALKGEERANPRFHLVREHLSNIFASSPGEEASVLAQLGTAELEWNDLLALCDPAGQRRQVSPKASLTPSRESWARAWLLDIGVDEWNPVTCSLFALHWINYYIMVVDSLRDFEPAV